VLHERLARICHCDYDCEIALVAENTDSRAEQSIMGVVRLSKVHGTNEALLSILIGDPYQGLGLGSELVQRAVEVARSEHLTRLTSTLTADNQVMLHLFQKLGFTIEPGSNDNLASATIKL
jgi:acetyltransferase